MRAHTVHDGSGKTTIRNGHHVQHPLRALATAAGAVVLTGVVAATAYWAGTTSAPQGAPSATSSNATPEVPPAQTPPPPDAAPSTPAATPEAAGLAWLTTTNTLSWRDPAPEAWVARAEPYLTGDALRAAAEARNGGAGPDWDRMTSDRCTQRVIDTGSVIPPEAPRSDTVVYVQVSGTVVQQCATGTPLPPQPIAATLELARSTEGTWRVSSQLF